MRDFSIYTVSFSLSIEASTFSCFIRQGSFYFLSFSIFVLCVAARCARIKYSTILVRICFHILLDMRDYALGIGMNLEEDTDLLWIAREGLKAALPKGWVPWFACDAFF